MKNMQEKAQALSEALQNTNEDMLRQAYDTDDAEKFRLLQGKTAAAKPEKDRPVTNFRRYATAAACLAFAVCLALVVGSFAKNFHSIFPDPTNPTNSPLTQPTDTNGTTVTTIPTVPTVATVPTEPTMPHDTLPTGPQDPSQVPPVILICGEQSKAPMVGGYDWNYIIDEVGYNIQSEDINPLSASLADQIPWIHVQSLVLPIQFQTLMHPDSVHVRCWPVSEQGNEGAYSEFEIAPISNRMIKLNTGSYIYEIVGEWNFDSTGYGTVRYVFGASTTAEPPQVDAGLVLSSGSESLSDPLKCLDESIVYDHIVYKWVTYYGRDGYDTLSYTDWSSPDAYMPVLKLNGELQYSITDGGSINKVNVYYRRDNGKFSYETSGETLDILQQLASGEWYVILNASWQGRYILEESEYETHNYDFLFKLEIPDRGEPKLQWEFDESSGTLTVFGLEQLPDFDEHSKDETPWYSIRNQVKTIVIGEGVKRIGHFAFYKFENLERVDLPAGLEEVGEYAFKDAAKLAQLDLPDSLRLIDKSSFAGCASLVYLTLPQSIETIAHQSFMGCTALREVTILGSPTVVNMAFNDCPALELIRFCGDLPASEIFYQLYPLTALCYYPMDNDTWTDAFFAEQNYEILWVASADPAAETVSTDPYSGPCGRMTRYTLKDGVLTISGTGPWTHVRWFEYMDQVKKLVIEDGVTTVAGSGCYNCTNLKEVSIADTVTEIGPYAFHGCTALTKIKVSANLTAIHSGAFYDCVALTQIVIPDGVTVIADYTFWGCTALKTVTLPNQLMQVGYAAFRGCTALTEITFPATLTSLGDGAFNGCTALKKLYFYGDPPSVGNFTFKNVNATAYYPPGSEKWEYGGLGYHGGIIIEKPDPNQPNNLCQTHAYGEWVVTKAPTVTQNGERERICTVCGHKQKETMAPIEPDYTQPTHPELGEPVASGKWDGGNVLWTLYSDGTLSIFGKRHMQGATNGNFPWKEYADQVTRIIVEEGLLRIAKQAFNNMPNLTTLELPSTLQAIGDEAFANCPKLTSVTIPASVTELGSSIFWSCSSLSTVEFADGCSPTSIPSNMFMDCAITEIVIPASVTKICTQAFSGCSQLTYVGLSEGIESIEKKAFNGCEKLASFTVPSTLLNIQSSAFAGCTGLVHLELYANVVYSYDFGDCPIVSVVFHDTLQIVSGFDDCKTLTSVTLPDTVHTIDNYAFFACPLTDIDWPASLTTIGYRAFSGAHFTHVVLPDTVTSLGFAAFASCPNLVSFVCGSGLEALDDSTLANCTKLVSVDLGNVKTLGHSMFKDCSALTTVIWSDHVESIGYHAFLNCTSLTSITIPAGMKTMDHSLFQGCTALQEVIFLGNAPSIGAYSFQGLTLTVYYPAGNSTWTVSKRDNYGGTITWVAIEVAP